MENQEYVFKIQELLDISTELIEVCVDHCLNRASKSYLAFEVEYDYDDGIIKLKTNWGYEIGGMNYDILVNNLKREHDFLIENFGEDIDFSDVLNYKIKGE